MSKTGIIYGVNGPVIYLKGDPGFKISEMVYVGKDNLVGEVIGLKKMCIRDRCISLTQELLYETLHQKSRTFLYFFYKIQFFFSVPFLSLRESSI